MLVLVYQNNSKTKNILQNFKEYWRLLLANYQLKDHFWFPKWLCPATWQGHGLNYFQSTVTCCISCNKGHEQLHWPGPPHTSPRTAALSLCCGCWLPYSNDAFSENWKMEAELNYFYFTFLITQQATEYHIIILPLNKT